MARVPQDTMCYRPCVMPEPQYRYEYRLRRRRRIPCLCLFVWFLSAGILGTSTGRPSSASITICLHVTKTYSFDSDGHPIEEPNGYLCVDEMTLVQNFGKLSPALPQREMATSFPPYEIVDDIAFTLHPDTINVRYQIRLVMVRNPTASAESTLYSGVVR